MSKIRQIIAGGAKAILDQPTKLLGGGQPGSYAYDK